MPNDHASPDRLRTARAVYDAVERADAAAGLGLPDGTTELAARSDGTAFDLDCFRHLMDDFRHRTKSLEFGDRAESDRWLAPRLHFALRIPRILAGDKGIWHWLAVVEAPDYVMWRWGTDDEVAANRWYGPINKQALARLWWGAEIFRDGSDYLPVEYAFARQDLPNSYLHRPLVRCRPFALGIVNALVESASGNLADLSSDLVNDLARVLNLCTAGRPPESVTGFQVDDSVAFQQWTASDAPIPATWVACPIGPAAHDTTEASVRIGTELARHGLGLAEG